MNVMKRMVTLVEMKPLQLNITSPRLTAKDLQVAATLVVRVKDIVGVVELAVVPGGIRGLTVSKRHVPIVSIRTIISGAMSKFRILIRIMRIGNGNAIKNFPQNSTIGVLRDRAKLDEARVDLLILQKEDRVMALSRAAVLN
jgi:hypothetical protein